MKDLEKKIEEAAKKYSLRLGYHDEAFEDEEAFTIGALSHEAKEYWQQGMYTYQDLKDAFETVQKQAYPSLSQDGSLQVDHSESFDEWFDSNKSGLKTQKMYTEEEVEKLLRKCWNAADDFREELDRICAGHSNFSTPHSPNFKKWFEQNKKKS